MVFDAPFLRIFAKRHEGKFKVVELNGLEGEDLAVAVAKERPELLAAVNAELKKLSDAGALAKLSYEWMDEMKWRDRVAD